MNLSWLRGVAKVGKAIVKGVDRVGDAVTGNPITALMVKGIPGAGIVQAVFSAANAVEAVSTAKGKEKEDQAVAMVPEILKLTGVLTGKDIEAAPIQAAIRETMAAYVAAQNAEERLRAAVSSLEAAVDAVKRG